MIASQFIEPFLRLNFRDFTFPRDGRQSRKREDFLAGTTEAALDLIKQ